MTFLQRRRRKKGEKNEKVVEKKWKHYVKKKIKILWKKLNIFVKKWNAYENFVKNIYSSKNQKKILFVPENYQLLNELLTDTVGYKKTACHCLKMCKTFNDLSPEYRPGYNSFVTSDKVVFAMTCFL